MLGLGVDRLAMMNVAKIMEPLSVKACTSVQHDRKTG